MKIKKTSYYGFDHGQVIKKFEGDLSFVNEFAVEVKLQGGGTDYKTMAVYKAKKPNREKGHKDYMLLFTVYDPVEDKSQLFVTGRTKAEMQKQRYQEGILCDECDTVLYSMARHDFTKCGCSNETFIDGGRDYARVGAMNLSKTTPVRIDLLTDKVRKLKKNSRFSE